MASGFRDLARQTSYCGANRGIRISKEACSVEANFSDVNLANLPRQGLGTVQEVFCGPATNVDQIAKLYLRDDGRAGCSSTDCSNCLFKPRI